MTENYQNAFTEVYEIINYLNEYDYNKIPKEIISVIEENRNQEYEYFLDESIPFTEQKKLPETKAILFNLFRDYLCTKEQKEKIINFQRAERIKMEEEKKKSYNYTEEIFKNKSNKKDNETTNESFESKELIKLEKNKLIFKLFNFIKKIFNKQ